MEFKNAKTGNKIEQESNAMFFVLPQFHTQLTTNTTGSKLLVEAIYNLGLLIKYHESQSQHLAPQNLRHVSSQNYQY